VIGQQWIAALPSGWKAQRADAVLDYKKTPARTAEFEGADVFHYSIPAIQETGDGIVQAGAEIESDKIGLDGGELIVSKLNPRKGCVLLTRPQPLPIVCSTEFVPLVARPGFDARFAFYVYSSTPVRELISAVVQSVTRSHQRANPEDITKLWIPVPPSSQQRAIADYLDRETARLDALVAAKERVLGLLAEKRRALITRAVTRGLDPRAPLRDSGIPWLSEIPAHWETRRLKHISPAITVGVVVNPSTYVTMEGEPFLYGSDITEDGINLDGVRRLPRDVSRNELAKTCLRPGDVVTVRVGAPGITAVVPPELDGANCASIMLIRGASTFDSQWLAYTMNSAVGRSQVRLVQYGAAQEQFNISHAVDFWFAVPSLDEQRELVSYLENATSALDDMRVATVHTIDLIKERRAALIAAAVTGQIDVEATA